MVYYRCRFAQFFIAPLFDPSCTEREREAVDSGTYLFMSIYVLFSC
jgi:hypothetical protein